MKYKCASKDLWFELDRDLENFEIKCLDDGSFDEPADDEWLNCVPSTCYLKAGYNRNMSKKSLFLAVFCPPAPDKPRGGKMVWNEKTTFGTTAEYECGPYAKFQAENSTEFYGKSVLTCLWNKTWSLEVLDPCICKL